MQASVMPSTFGARLAARRKALKLTQEQLGEGMGPDGTDLGKAAVSSWEVDRTQPNAMQLARICERLRCSADELLGIEPRDTGQRRRSTDHEHKAGA